MKYKLLEFLMSASWKLHNYIFNQWRDEWIKYQKELLIHFVENWDNGMALDYATEMFDCYCCDEYSSKEYPYSPGSALIEDRTYWDS